MSDARSTTPMEIGEERKIPRLLMLAYLLFLGLHCAPVVTASPKLWGVDQWYYYSKAAIVALLVIGIAPLFRRPREGAIMLASRIAGSAFVKRVGSKASLTYLLLLVPAACLFWIFRQSTHFLGDGYLWASRMESGTLFSFMRPLSSSIYQMAYASAAALGLSHPISAFTAAAVVSLSSGMVFLVFAYKTARLLSDRATEQLFLLLAMLASGTVTLFFGYVEAYAPVAAGVMAYLYFRASYVRKRENAYFVVVVFLVNVSLHISTIALLPSLIVMLTSRESTARTRRIYRLVSGVLILAGIVALGIAERHRAPSAIIGDTLLPVASMRPSPRTAYSMFSFEHLFDFLNEILLIAPIVLFAWTGLFRAPRARDRFDAETMLFLQTIILFYTAEYVVFNTILGAGRDWDIFSPLGLPLSLYAAMMLLERFRSVGRQLAVFACMAIVLQTGPWIGINASSGKSLERFVNLTETGYWSPYARGYAYELLGKHSYNNQDRAGARSYFLSASRADPRTVRYKKELAELSIENHQYPQALKYYQEILDQEPNAADVMNSIGLLILHGATSQRDAAEDMFVEAIRADPTFLQSYVNLAKLYMQTGRMQQAVGILKKSIEVAPGAAELYQNLGKVYDVMGEADSARSYFDEAERLERGEKK
jgi:tetratricopeptide (TPR) repeat protein